MLEDKPSSETKNKQKKKTKGKEEKVQACALMKAAKLSWDDSYNRNANTDEQK